MELLATRAYHLKIPFIFSNTIIATEVFKDAKGCKIKGSIQSKDTNKVTTIPDSPSILYHFKVVTSPGSIVHVIHAAVPSQ